MNMEDNWQVNAPWAQLVASTKVPDELFKNALEMTDKIYEDVNRDSAGPALAGQINNEYYMDMVFKIAVQKKYKIKNINVKSYYSLGTPEELIKWKKKFEKQIIK